MNGKVVGALLAFGGFWLAVFGVLWNLVNYEDELPRCSAGFGCSSSALQRYWMVCVASTVMVVIGLFAIAFGVWLFIRRGRNPTGVNREMSPPSS